VSPWFHYPIQAAICSALAGVLLGVAELPEPMRAQVAAVLADWYRILELRLHTEPTV